VAFDDTDPVSIQFSSPVISFSGYFIYLSPITITAFDPANTSIASVHLAFATNLALSGNRAERPMNF